VFATFWLGGVGLSIMKAIAYIATDSVLVRASMFDSVGDVISSAILAATQHKVNDHSDLHRYPVGKGRLVPLGVLFFCAFMCSTMSSMFMDAMQSFLDWQEPEVGADAALRRLFQEKPWLRWGYGPRGVEALIVEYGGRADVDVGRTSVDRLSPVLMLTCVAIKLLLFCACRYVARLRGSEIVSALAVDHRNDSLTNGIVFLAMAFVSRLKDSGVDSPWLLKADPAITLFMSAWIAYGWLSTALEQLVILDDRRPDNAEDVESAVSGAAARALPVNSPLTLQTTSVYAAGEGSRVLLQLCPADGDTGAARVADVLEALDSAVRGSQSGVQQVDAVLRPCKKLAR